MAAAAPSIASPFIALGVIACIGALCAVICAVCCCCAAAKERGDGGGGGAFSTGVKHEGLLDKSKDSAAAAGRPQQGGGGGQQQRGPGPDPWGDGDVELCAICKARLAEAGWGGLRWLRPCGHVYHPHCVAPWLEARGTCPLCRAPVVGGAGDRDGLVACHLPGGRIGLGRRVAGRVYEVRILDEDGKLVRPRVLQRGFKGVRLRLRARMAVGLKEGALDRRDLAVVADVQ